MARIESGNLKLFQYQGQSLGGLRVSTDIFLTFSRENNSFIWEGPGPCKYHDRILNT